MDIVIVEMFFCHVILQDHVIKGLCDFEGWSSLWQVTTLPSLLVMGITAVTKVPNNSMGSGPPGESRSI